MVQRRFGRQAGVSAKKRAGFYARPEFLDVMYVGVPVNSF
jgi:hypothetical protein